MAWCNSDAQLGDGLTKAGAAWKLEDFFAQKQQQWRLVFDEKILSAKRRKALGLGPLEEAIEKLAPDDMLAARRSEELSPLADPTATTAKDTPFRVKDASARRKHRQGINHYVLDWI